MKLKIEDMRTFFLWILICFSLQAFAQKDYRRLSIELIQQALNNRVISETSFSIFEKEINSTPDDKLNLFFNEKARKIFTEIAYGRKPSYLQYLSLKEELDHVGIDSCLSIIENESQIAQIIAELEPQNPEYLAQKNLSLLDSLPQLRLQLKKSQKFPTTSLEIFKSDKITFKRFSAA